MTLSVHLLASLALLALTPASGTRDGSVVSRSGFTVRFQAEGLEGVVGDELDEEERADALARIEGWSSEYPAGFLDKYVREVIVLDDLKVDGIAARGHRNGHLVLVEYGSRSGHQLEKRDFDHEVFHALDGYLGEAPLGRAWEEDRRRALALRDLWEDYRITPSRRYTLSWERFARRLPWMAYVPLVGLIWVIPHALDDGGPQEGFAYPQGAVSPREDRATVAEALMSGDEEFLRRAAADPELREKVGIVKAMYRAGSEGAIAEEFWSRLAPGQFDVPNLAALQERLERERAQEAREPLEGEGAEAASSPAEPEEMDAAAPHPDPDPKRPLTRPPVIALVDDEPAHRAPAAAKRASPDRGRVRPPVVVGAVPETSAAPPPGVASSPPVPAPAPGATSPSVAYQEGLAAFQARDYQRAAARWRSMLEAVDPAFATVQVAINCSLDNALKNRELLGEKASFYMLPIRYREQACQLTLTGLYKNRDEAALAIAGLPPAIREQKPRAALIREVLALVGGRGSGR